MKTVFCLFLCLIVFQHSNSQNSLKGSIIDESTGEPLQGASVYAVESNKGVLTGQNGNYTISGLGKGTFHFKISYLGYQPIIEEVSFSGDSQTKTLDAELIFHPLRIDEVVVSTAYFNDQRKNTYPVEVVNHEALGKTGAFTVMDVIEKRPGVDAITTGPMVSRPVIRGLSGNRVLTVVNGARFETQQWDDEHGIGVNELGMDHVEIIKGPASLLYGSEAMGGVVNFVEEEPAEVGTTRGSAMAGLYSNNPGAMAKAKVKSANEDFNWGFSALGKLFSDYFYNGYDFRVPNTRLLEYGAKAYAGVNKKWSSSTLSYVFNNAYYGILDGKDIVKDENGQIKNIDTLEKEKFPLEIEAPFHHVTDHRITSRTTVLAGDSKVQGVLSYQNNHRSENEEHRGSKKGYTYLDMALQTYTYDLKWYLPEWNNFQTIIGSQGMHKKNNNLEGAATQLVPNATINDLGFLALTKYDMESLNLSAGIRYDRRNLESEMLTSASNSVPGTRREYDNISWSFGARYNLLKNLLLRASYASGYRSPNLNELFSYGVKLESQRYEIGNADFVKEQNREWDLSLHYDLADFSFDIAVFGNQIQNYIYLAPTGNTVQGNMYPEKTYPEYEFRQTDARITGGEGSLDIHPRNLNWGHLEIKASTLTGKREDNNSYLPMMPPTRLYNTLYLDLDDFRNFHDVIFDIGTQTTFEQTQVAENELETPAYTLLDAGLAVDINKVHWSLNAHNILNKKYVDHMSRFRSYDIIEPGMNVTISAKIPFAIN
ncbi:MAG: TonB-dependent receptor [Christiangramia sp.]|nr:TonB-dependent receptor [Christiangramia sp.]